MTRWTHESIPDQSGRTAIVTGANTGIGFEAAKALAAKGADVILACRSEERAAPAVAKITQAGGKARFMRLDLGDLASVKAFADAFSQEHNTLDLLINNAGVMMPPRGKTKDGFELQIGINHLGHFALTAQLFPLLAKTPGARVVTVSSQAHRQGVVDVDDLHFDRRKYSDVASYGQSKLANLLFTFELQRRIDDAGLDITAVAAHPGWTQTDLQRHSTLFQMLNPLFAMKPPQGALPTLRAAVGQDTRGADYFGPHGVYEMRGYPQKVKTIPAALDEQNARALWAASENQTGVAFDVEQTVRAAA